MVEPTAPGELSVDRQDHDLGCDLHYYALPRCRAEVIEYDTRNRAISVAEQLARALHARPRRGAVTILLCRLLD
jgi:hypothetical protein